MPGPKPLVKTLHAKTEAIGQDITCKDRSQWSRHYMHGPKPLVKSLHASTEATGPDITCKNRSHWSRHYMQGRKPLVQTLHARTEANGQDVTCKDRSHWSCRDRSLVTTILISTVIPTHATKSYGRGSPPLTRNVGTTWRSVISFAGRSL